MDSAAYKVDTWSQWIHDGYERDMRYSTREALQQWPASDVDYAHELCNTSNPSAVSWCNAYKYTCLPVWNDPEGKVVISPWSMIHFPNL